MYPELLVRHTTTARSRGVLRLTALCLAWLGLGLTSAAAAALPADGDFDHDGVPDTAIVRPTGTGSQIVVRLSGSAVPLYLSPAAPVRALRSADVTGDGVVSDGTGPASGFGNATDPYVPIVTCAATAET